jgi:hypothetical protein
MKTKKWNYKLNYQIDLSDDIFNWNNLWKIMGI